MSIIEKLGIKSEHKTSMVNGDIVLKLENQRNKLLEALIDSIIFIEEITNDISDGEINLSKMFHYQSKISAVEKATGEPWSEIKELLG